MNTIWIVMPILIVLMFLLGTELTRDSFTAVARKPAALILGTIGQIVLLPLVAFAVAWILGLSPAFFMGLVLIACCPGGSSSNAFSMLAKGDVALSVALTAISSVVTLFTLPVIMQAMALYVSSEANVTIELPVGKLLMQNLALMFVPMLLGVIFRRTMPRHAAATNRLLGKAAFPALMLLALLFFLQYPKVIAGNFATLGTACTLLIIVTMACGSLLSRAGKLTAAARRTIVIEIGMQNAAQAIAIASSPIIFNNDNMAIPAIIYALLMNVILLIYVFYLRKKQQ